jgi:lysophospholipase L1-like esterase
MKPVFILFLFFTINNACYKHPLASMSPSSEKKYNYLALGDSYTIGEMVPAPENFPTQFAALLNADNIDMAPPRIIAVTGWTTDELEKGITEAQNHEPLLQSYDFVTLLIGVNNQYRGRPVNDYKNEFEELLKKAILYAGSKPDHVAVLSIPDWGVTPFAQGMDRAKIASEIDAFNAANKEISSKYKVHYLDITTWTREASSDPGLLAGDGLHPSGKEYNRWAQKLAGLFRQIVK